MKKEKKVKNKNKEKRNRIRWYKLDNTAHLFPVIAGENLTNVYRISVELKEEIVKERLQEALDIVLPKFDVFNVRLRRGVFWFYFEENGKPAPRVLEENTFPSRFIQQNRNRSYMFRVTYYKRRINLEVFHILTDGMGGINFLRELTYQYLRLSHSSLREKAGDNLSQDTSLNREDSFIKNYKTAKKSGFKKRKAYLIHMDRLGQGEIGLMHGIMSVGELKSAAGKYKASINEYLVSLFAYSTYQECLLNMPSNKPIRIAVPVNLRPYFDSVTTRNFFVVVSAEFWPKEERIYTFEEVLSDIKESLRSQITKEHLEDLFSYSVSNQKNLFLRAVPLFFKNIAIKSVYSKSALANTSTVTNIGNISVEEEYREYIDNFHAFISASKGQYIKGTICSYGDKLTFTFSSLYSETHIQKAFFRKLAEDGVEVSLETNGVYYE